MLLQTVIRVCPRCGSAVKLRSSRLIDCKACAFQYYIAPSPCNGAILANEKGEILLVKRATHPKKGFWDLPGGFIDFRETAEDSMFRELSEELQIRPTNLRYFSSYEDIYTYKGIGYHTLGLVYTGTVVGKRLAPHDDITDCRFFHPKRIPFSRVAFSSVKNALRDYLRHTTQTKRVVKRSSRT